MYGCESGTIKKAEPLRIDAFELWCWRRLLRVPWTERRSNQSILKEISPEYSLEGLMLKLKLQYFGHLMQRADSLGKKLGNITFLELKKVSPCLPVLCWVVVTVQSLSHVWLFATPWTAAHQVSLSVTNSQSLIKLMSIESMMPPLSSSSPTFSLSQHQGLFQWVNSLHQVAKVLELQLQHQSFQWIFRIDFL